MNTTLTEAAKEAFTLCPSNVAYLYTLELAHPDITSIFVVQDTKSWDLTLEGSGGVKTFRACGFRMSLPSAGENGIQELAIGIDNVGREISDFLDAVEGSTDPVLVTFRPYAHTDTTAPLTNPPLTLELKDVQQTDVEVTGKASFADLVNKPFLTQFYTREQFPGLGN